MKEINRFSLAKEAKEVYFREPFFALSKQDLLKFNTAASAGLDMPTGGRVVLLHDEEHGHVYLMPTRKEDGFVLHADKRGSLSMASQLLATWLRAHFKLQDGKSYRFQMRSRPTDDGKPRWLVLEPKLYKGNN